MMKEKLKIRSDRHWHQWTTGWILGLTLFSKYSKDSCLKLGQSDYFGLFQVIFYRVVKYYLSIYMQQQHKEGTLVDWKTRDQIKSSNHFSGILQRTVCGAMAMHNLEQLFRWPLDGVQVVDQNGKWRFQLKLELVLVDSDKNWTSHATNWIKLIYITEQVFSFVNHESGYRVARWYNFQRLARFCRSLLELYQLGLLCNIFLWI